MKERITRKSIIKKSIIWDDVWSMIRHGWAKFLFMSIIMGFLLFFFNLLLGVGSHAREFSETVRDKLSMFFYVKDLPGETENVYTKVLSLQQELEKADIKTDFVSDKEGEQFLKNRVPDLFEQLDDYGIDSPFLATLYIKIPDKQSYDTVSQIVPKYSDIMFNVSDLTQSRTLQEQEKRIVRTVNFTQSVMVISYTLIVLFLLIIAVVFFFLIQNKFQEYHNQIEIKKLLGASYWQIKLPFLLTSTALLLCGFVVMVILMLIVNSYAYQFDLSIQYFSELFHLDITTGEAFLKNYFGPSFWLVLLEIIVFVTLLWLVASLYLQRLIKKVYLA